MYSKLTFAAALAVASLGGAAHAGTPLVVDADARSEHVSLAGLDLDRPADAKIALARIRRAAEDVCGLEDIPPLALDRAAYYRDCVETSTADAAERLGAELVIGLAEGHAAPRG